LVPPPRCPTPAVGGGGGGGGGAGPGQGWMWEAKQVSPELWGTFATVLLMRLGRWEALICLAIDGRMASGQRGFLFQLSPQPLWRRRGFPGLHAGRPSIHLARLVSGLMESPGLGGGVVKEAE
jgi:hypothetical protein